MLRIICRAKIHRARVTETNLNYEGSITLDVFNLNNGARFNTYTIEGEPDSGKVCINGAAARLAQVGDEVIIVSYALVDEEEIEGVNTRVLFVDQNNRPTHVRES